VQRHEDSAEQVADDQADDRPPDRQAVDGRRQRAGDDGEQHHVGCEPDREQVADLALALGSWHLGDRSLLNLDGGLDSREVFRHRCVPFLSSGLPPR